VSQTPDTCREKCRKLRHSRVASLPLRTERLVFSQLPGSRSEPGFGSGGAPCLGVEATRYWNMVYSRRGELTSASAPSAVQSSPMLPAQSFRLDLLVRELLRRPRGSSSRPARAERTPGAALALLSPAFPPRPELLHETMPPPARQSSRYGSSAHGSREAENRQ
jgi:hypothetical protein